MIRYSLLFCGFFLFTSLLAQPASECLQGFFVLKGNTLFQLNVKTDGRYQFIPYYQAAFIDSIAGLSYNEEDGYWYAFHSSNAHLFRGRLDGQWEDLGRPIHQDSSTALPNHDLGSTVYHNGELFTVAYSTNRVYAIDLQSQPLTYRVVHEQIRYALPNTLAFNPLTKQLFIFEQMGKPLSIHPNTGQLSRPERGTYTNFPRNSFISFGKLWFTKTGRCFLLMGNDGVLYELDTDKRVAYEIAFTGFKSLRDATNCPSAFVPSYLDPELLALHALANEGYGAVQVFWRQGNNNTVYQYELEAYRPNTKVWESVQILPAFPYSKQYRHYAAMDRFVKTGNYCYRVKIHYKDGTSRYSHKVCVDYPKAKDKTTPQITCSPKYSEGTKTLHLSLKALKQQTVSVKVIPLFQKQAIVETTYFPSTDDQSYTIVLPNQTNWYKVLIQAGTISQRFSLFRTTVD